MARNPNPVRPRKKDAKDYEAALRQTYLDPMFGRIRGRPLKLSQYPGLARFPFPPEPNRV